jgi:integrase
MKRHSFSKAGILAMPLPHKESKKGYLLYPDPEQANHYVLVTKNGTRSFVVDKNTKRGRVRITLGPAGTDAMTALQARERARIALGLIAEGYTREQIDDRLARSQEEIPSGAPTLGEVLEQYLTERAHKLSERTRTDYRRIVDTHLADWKARPMEVIDETAVVAKFTSIRGTRRANYTMQVARLLFRYARSIKDANSNPIVSRNPVDVLSQRRLWHTEKPSREVIERVALKPWWKAVQSLDSDGEVARSDDGRFAEGTAAANSNAETVRDFLLFLVLTGLRRNEAATLKWEDVNLRSKMFTVPDTKNHEPHSLPLSDFLYTMLKRRHAAMLKDRGEAPRRAEYVFPGELGPLAEPKKQIAKVVAASGVEFSSHTLRRTFASIAESLDIPYLALKRLLNHKAQDVTGKHYTVIDVERLREPMQKITDFVLKTAGERKSAAVVKLEQRGARA